MRSGEKFMDWFVAQYGERPGNLDLATARDFAETARRLLAVRERDLAAVEEWELRREAALKGWCVHD